MKKFLRVSDAARYLEVSPHTIRIWTNQGRLKTHRNVSNQRIFYKEDLDQFIAEQTGTPQKEQKIFYVRSSNGQDVTMETQIEKLTQAYGEPDYVFKDKASGLRENRTGLNQMINHISESQSKSVIYITNNDRLTRFGFSYLEMLMTKMNTSIIVLDSKETKEPHQVLMEDFMSLIASFSGKFYRIRGWEQQAQLIKDAEKIIDKKQSKG